MSSTLQHSNTSHCIVNLLKTSHASKALYLLFDPGFPKPLCCSPLCLKDHGLNLLSNVPGDVMMKVVSSPSSQTWVEMEAL